ncbi:MAG: LysE family transporter, partial [Muribaculaceae bacterium]|nr:LysE family transporter [Muribaculaceae bacterium]
MILRGLVIGVVVSAPMGPVGIYCIQRTLDKGRLSGFYTGVGAAISDLIYCLLTGFGLSFIEDFISNHRNPIQLLGSIVLIFFGIWLIRKQPDGGSIAADADHDAPSREGDILKGFALTFSNPLILFLIIGLFAQFNFVIEGIKFYHYVLGFIGIVGGALGWWWLVTHFVDKLRGHFTQRTMKLINMVIGVIILIFAAVGIFSSASSMILAGTQAPRMSQEVVSVSFRVADSSM